MKTKGELNPVSSGDASNTHKMTKQRMINFAELKDKIRNLNKRNKKNLVYTMENLTLHDYLIIDHCEDIVRNVIDYMSISKKDKIELLKEILGDEE